MNASHPIHDLLIVGGGINGAGIARDAAGRGLSVALCEKGDMAGATSWASSKLIHGGLRYLEHGSLGLVRESLMEREILMHIAPHLVRPLRFTLPHSPALRPAWMIRLGLWLYDYLGGGSDLLPSRKVRLGDQGPLKPDYRTGFEYSDLQVDDARLVIDNLRDAAARGATIHARTRLVTAIRNKGFWQCELRDSDDAALALQARAIVNAAGPWAAQMHAQLGGQESIGIQLVRGSHIVVPRRYAGEQAYTLQNDDGRVVFVLPFRDEFTLIGTTEIRMASPDEPPIASDDEVDYLCRAVNRYLRDLVTPANVVWKFSGVRPLLDDGKSRDDTSRASREYRFLLDKPHSEDPALLTIVGGKLTTYRRLAERALEKLAPFFSYMGPSWTDDIELPEAAIDHRHEPGRDFGGGLCERDARYYLTQEWARQADDILWRRTKAGLRMSAQQQRMFAAWLEEEKRKMKVPS